ncbi:MAG: extracellular solute-binding protein [Erysipelotrichaceae bacterium]|nr:extracellular solute-binding protein [Erysipelotrichaceae bacterium]
MKKLLSTLIASLMLLSVSACSPSSNNSTTTETKTGDTVSLTVWGSQEEQAVLQGMVDEFIQAHPETKWDIKLGVVSEADAKTRYLEDPAAAADVFAFANDQINDLVGAGALYKVTRNAEEIKSRNSEGSIEGASYDGQLYGYPMTADNGYFLYYDSSVFTEEDVKSLDAMLAKAAAANKKVFMDVSNGWYIASFFLGNGGTLTIEDGVQVTNFNNEKGLETAEAIKAFTADPAFLTGDDSILVAGMGDTIAAGVSGTWNAAAIKEALGDNYAATKLPEFTTKSGLVQMGSFVGYKVLGVNSQTKYPEQAMDLADFLTNEDNQKKRFEARQLLPSNINAASMPEVSEDVAIAALQAQNPFGTSQKNVLGTYWAPAEAFGATMEAKDYSTDLKTLLDTMVEQISTKPSSN